MRASNREFKEIARLKWEQDANRIRKLTNQIDILVSEIDRLRNEVYNLTASLQLEI